MTDEPAPLSWVRITKCDEDAELVGQRGQVEGTAVRAERPVVRINPFVNGILLEEQGRWVEQADVEACDPPAPWEYNRGSRPRPNASTW